MCRLMAFAEWRNGPGGRKGSRGQDRRPRHAAGLSPWSARRLQRHAGWSPACRCLPDRLGRSGFSPCFAAARTLELASWPVLTTSASEFGLALPRRVVLAAVREPSASSARCCAPARRRPPARVARSARQRSRGAEKGRGYVAARLVGSRLGPRSRRVVIKARLVVFAKATPWLGGGSPALHSARQRHSRRRAGPRLLGRAGRRRRRAGSRRAGMVIATSSASSSHPRTQPSWAT